MATTIIYQCPNCGAGLTFDAEKQKFCCEFCLSEFLEEQVSNTKSAEEMRREEDEREEYNAHMREYECSSCGAHIMADEHTVADFCYYCHNPVVLIGRLSGQMKPQRIVPFKYNKEEAQKKFLQYARKKWFVPNAFFEQSQAEKISGVYYPFWITDADTDSTMTANATRVRVWRRGNVEYTETSKFKIHRRGNIHFEDITSSALSEADKHMLEGILPFPSEALEEFSAPYLSGYLAKKRDIEREALNDEIKSRMNDYAATLLKRTAQGYSAVSVEDMQLNIQKSHWEYSLLPIWVLNYRSPKGKLYTYAMNGHTGKIYGELPISFFKLGLLLAAIAVPLTALFTLIGGALF